MTARPDENGALQDQISKLQEKYEGDDAQLRADLSQHGLGFLPFSSQTKKMLLKKLAQKLQLQDNPSCSTTSSQSEDTEEKRSTSDESVSESSLSFSSDDPNRTFYALCIPGEDDQILIESDFLEVLKKMKEHTKKKPRMLSFSSYSDAVAFANNTSANDVCQRSLIKATYPKEKAELETNESLPFPSVTVPQLNAFRLNLERGNTVAANEMLSSNPRYLIGTGDVPTILKVGPRYNALHACAFTGQLSSCKLIMKFLCDINYLKKMYDSKERAEKYSKRLVDLYLNTPEKMMNKAPLHFASEKGFVEIVAFLISFKACDRLLHREEDKDVTDKDLLKKNTPTPIEIACDKFYGREKEAVKQKIINLIREATCFVPLVRSDTTGPYAKVVEPYSPSSLHCLVKEIEENLKPATDDLKDFSNLKVWAYAGPMSPQEAHKFKREWWSPRVKKEPAQRSTLLNVTDGERGFEHFGRELARSYKVPWQEYWPFLDSFADFNTMEGLKKLQHFLLKHSVLLQVEQLSGQRKLLKSEPLVVSEEFVTEGKEDNESYVSANSLSSLASLEEESDEGDYNRLQGGVIKLKEDFFDCEEKLEDQDFGKAPDESYTSPFGRIWNGLVQLGYYLSPRKRNKDYSPQTSTACISNDYDANFNTVTSETVNNDTKNVKCNSEERDVNGSPATSSCSEKDGNKWTVNKLNQGIWSRFEQKYQEIGNGDNGEVKELITDNVNKEPVLETEEFKSNSISKTHMLNSEKEEPNSSLNNTSSTWEDKTPKFMSTPVSLNYRNTTSDVISPVQSDVPSGQSTPSSVLESPDLKSSDLMLPSVSNQTSYVSNTVSEGDSSFDRKMDSFCRTLQTFSLMSPVKNADSTDSIEEKKVNRPLVELFTDQDVSPIEKMYDFCVKNMKSPILMMKQGKEKCVIADLYLPVTDVEFMRVLDENTHKSALENVWTNFLVTFTSWCDATSVLTSEKPEMISVRLRSIPANKETLLYREFDLSKLVEEYKKYKTDVHDEKDDDEIVMEMLAIRSSTLPRKDIYICGSVATKTDADVYKSFNDDTVSTIRQQHSLASVNQWFESMAHNSQDCIESLPSPSRVRQLAKHSHLPPPVSPLVKNDMSSQGSRFMHSPRSSRMKKDDPVVRNIFKESLDDCHDD